MSSHIQRRKFIALFSGAAAAPLLAPLPVRAQQRAIPVIGYLDPESQAGRSHLVAALLRGLEEAGFAEGRDFRVEFAWGESHYDQLPALAAELVRRRVDLIATGGGTASLAAKAATTTIPIVAYFGTDPVELGLLKSFNRPEGNITGVNQLAPTLEAKRLELLHELVPNASIAALVHADIAMAAASRKNLREAARLIGVDLLIENVGKDRDIETAFVHLSQARAGAVLVGIGGFLNSRRTKLAALAAHYRLPAMFPRREDVRTGGLMSYGADQADAFRLVGVYAGRILGGAKPADLPILQPTKIELLINLKTAKALGLTIPPKLLALADEVIE